MNQKMVVDESPSSNRKYFLYSIFVLILVQVIDSYTTSFPTVVPSSIINEFLSEFTENTATAIFSLATAMASFGMYFCAFNTYLSDKLGRRTMLAVTVFGMVIVALLLNFSTSILDFTIYYLLLLFFTQSDIWMIYVGEEAPKEKRAFWTNLVLIFGIAGALLAPIMRSIFITETTSNWRGMTWFIVIIGIPLGLLIIFTLKEPKIYTEMKDEFETKQRIISLKENVSGVFKSDNRKEIIVCLIISFILGINSIFRNLMEEAASSSAYLNQQEVSSILLVGVFSIYIAVILIGIFADKFGRLPLLYFFSILVPFARLMFTIVAFQPILTFPLTAFFGAMSEFGYWGAWITLSIVILELVPTDARGTGSGLKSFFGAFGVTLGFISTSIITNISNLSTSFVILASFILIIIPLIYKYLKETKMTDMKDIARLKR